MEIRWRIGPRRRVELLIAERMLDDPTEHVGYLIVEATAQWWAGVGVTLLRQEKFSVRLWM
jgi:hypothetical protein